MRIRSRSFASLKRGVLRLMWIQYIAGMPQGMPKCSFHPEVFLPPGERDRNLRLVDFALGNRVSYRPFAFLIRLATHFALSSTPRIEVSMQRWYDEAFPQVLLV